MSIKKNMRTFWYFGGYCKQDFNVMYPYVKAPVNREELYSIYRGIPKRDVLFFDFTDDGTKYEVISLSQNTTEDWFTVSKEDSYEKDITEDEGVRSNLKDKFTKMMKPERKKKHHAHEGSDKDKKDMKKRKKSAVATTSEGINDDASDGAGSGDKADNSGNNNSNNKTKDKSKRIRPKGSDQKDQTKRKRVRPKG
jgi:hypothetical protein